MNKVKYLALMMLLVLGVAAVQAQESTANAVITLERTACFGTCPVYTVSILEDGTVIYNGENHVQTSGEQTSSIDPALVPQVVEAFAEAGYFEWDEAYDTMTVSDLPTITTSVTRDGETHQIVRYAGDDSAPLALPFLELWIDMVANTAMWTGATPDIGSVSAGANSPFITLQRDPCFGFCPVYNAALFEDGTVVYLGIANVDRIGVHIYQVEPDTLTSIAMRAQALGYFGWNDAYDYMVMTDQSYVTSMIRWEDEYKRILRYDGDPNAPVGLVWIEEMIDYVVNEAVLQ